MVAMTIEEIKTQIGTERTVLGELAAKFSNARIKETIKRIGFNLDDAEMMIDWSKSAQTTQWEQKFLAHAGFLLNTAKQQRHHWIDVLEKYGPGAELVG